MKAMKMNRKTKKAASGLVCVLMALSLAFLQVPVGYAAPDADEPAQAAPAQTAPAAALPDGFPDEAFGGASDAGDALAVGAGADGEAAWIGDAEGDAGAQLAQEAADAEGVAPEGDGAPDAVTDAADEADGGQAPAQDAEGAGDGQAAQAGPDVAEGDVSEAPAPAPDANADEQLPAGEDPDDGGSPAAEAPAAAGTHAKAKAKAPASADATVALKARVAFTDSRTGAPQGMDGGRFSFMLMPADDADADWGTLAASADAEGEVSFADLAFTADMLEGAPEKTFEFDMVQVIPDTAEQVVENGRESGWWMDGDVLYDGASHGVSVRVSKAADGTFAVQAAYDGDASLAETGPTFANKHVSAHQALRFSKYYYGGDSVDFREFAFVLEAVKDVDMDAGTYEVRGQTGFDVPEGGEIADDGTRPFTFQSAVSAGAFQGSARADVDFPAIRFVHDGDYCYVVYEGSIDYVEEPADGERPIAEDSAKYLVRVNVEGGEVASTEYRLIYGDDVFEVFPDDGDELAFYNNAADVVDFADAPSYAYVEDTATTRVYPRAKKLVNGQASRISANQFAFQLLDAEGNVLATSTNDEDGDVAFFDEGMQPGLEFDEPGVYTYEIREVVPPQPERLPSVTYDTGVATVTVDVREKAMADADGGRALEASVSYAGPNQPQDLSADYAIFNNLMEGIDVRVQKRSAETGEGLAGCTYALWMRTSSGDVMLSEAESGADGWMTFEGTDVLPGYKYYFKEAAAPSGYVLDPYRSDFFELRYDADAGGYALVSAE